MMESRIEPERLDHLAYASRKPPELMHHRLLRCSSCDLVYASPAPRADALAQAYREAGYDSGHESRYASATYARLLSEILPRLPGKGGAVDIGAGDGAFLSRLVAAGFEDVVGIEPSAAPIDAAAPEVRPLLRQDVFSPENFESGSLRLVTALQLLEHVPDPLGLCTGVCDLLHPGGALLVVCHDRTAPANRLMGRRSPIFDIEHLQLFSPRSLRALLERAGFGQVEVRRVVNRYPLRYWLRLAPLPGPLKSRLLMAARGRLGSRPLSLPAGNITAIGIRE